MSDWLMWLGAQRSDVLTGFMVVAVALNLYAFIRQQRTLVELRRLLLRVREEAIERRPLVLSNGDVGHRYHVAPRPRGAWIGGESNDH